MSDNADAAVGSKPAAGRARWLMPALVVSLALNLLVAGMFVADYMRPEPRGRGGTPSFSEILPRSFFRELPDERRAEFRSVFRKNRPAFREDRQALRDSALAVADRLSAQPFDDAATRAAIDAYGNRSRELIDLGMTVANEIVAGLTPEERLKLAEHIRKRAEARRSKREKKDSGGE
ncbi:MAG: periplasmic heavy metal sensor [Parvibaculaceae bacterium]